MNTEEVRQHFQAQVSGYPDLMRRIIPFYDEQREMILRLIPFEQDRLFRLLDLGCGPWSLHHLKLSERPEFFRRAFSSLNDGGILIAAEVIIDESRVVREQQYQLWCEFMVQNGEDGMHWYGRHLEKDHPVTISSLLAMLSEAGFEAAGCFWRCLNFAIVSASRAAA